MPNTTKQRHLQESPLQVQEQSLSTKTNQKGDRSEDPRGNCNKYVICNMTTEKAKGVGLQYWASKVSHITNFPKPSAHPYSLGGDKLVKLTANRYIFSRNMYYYCLIELL